MYLHDCRGIAFDAADGLPVRQILALLVPQPATLAHFELLNRLTRHFGSLALREELARCSRPDHVCDVLASWTWR